MLPVSHLCSHKSGKVLEIHSIWIGTLKNTFLGAICVYICFALVSDKLYQRKEPVISSVHTKVKGIAEVTENVTEGGVTKLGHSIFDTADYTFPLQGNSFFVMTNYVKSEGQVQTLCPEDLSNLQESNQTSKPLLRNPRAKKEEGLSLELA